MTHFFCYSTTLKTYSEKGLKNCHRTRSLQNVTMCTVEAMKFSTWDSLEIEWILPKFLSRTGAKCGLPAAILWPFWLKLSHIGSTGHKNYSRHCLSRLCPNVSTTPLQQWGFQQCLPFSWTTLRGKHCWHPIAVMGVVDTIRL